MLYWQFPFKNEISVTRSFTKRKWTYVLDFGPRKRGPLNVGYVDKRPSRMQRQVFLRREAGQATSFRSRFIFTFFWLRFLLRGCPKDRLSRWPRALSQPRPLKVRRGEFNKHPPRQTSKSGWTTLNLSSELKLGSMFCRQSLWVFSLWLNSKCT